MPFLDEDGVTRLTEDYLDIFAQKEELGILTKESTGEVSGPLAEVTAKGHAEQRTTTGKNLLGLGALIDEEAYKCSAIVNSDGSATITASETSAEFWIGRTMTSAGATFSGSVNCLVPVTEGATYTLKSYGSASRCLITWLDSSKKSLSFITAFTTEASAANPAQITPPTGAAYALFRVGRNAADGIAQGTSYLAKIQLELGSTATAYEPYTGGAPSPSPDYPQEIQVARGRNLLDIDTYALQNDRGLSFVVSGGVLSYSGTTSNNYAIITEYQQVSLAAGSYTLSIGNAVSHRVYIDFRHADDTETDLIVEAGTTSATLTVSKEVTKLRLIFSGLGTGTSYSGTIYPQLELGSTPTPYVPYGHVGLEVRDATTDALMSVTAIPLPSRGWVAGLPDGTADTLTLDGAGHVEWRNETWEIALDGTESGWKTENSGKRVQLYTNLPMPPKNPDSVHMKTTAMASHFAANNAGWTWMGNVGIAVQYNNFSFADGTGSMAVDAWKTWLSTHPVTVLYPLATPVTEDCGYVDMPDILSDCTVTIPELDDLGIKYWLDRSGSIKTALDAKLNTSEYRAGMTWGELEGSVTWGDLEGDLTSAGTTYTENYHLAKPGLNDDAGIGTFNDNMDDIDDILADKLDDADYRKAMTWGEVGDKYNWGVLGTTSQTTGTTYTDTLSLEKPGNNSTVDIDVINDNYDIIDDAIEKTQENTAMIESHTAQSNHAIGSYFMLDNVLHKATSAIASGETITSGSNATPITIEQALSTLNSQVSTLQDSVSPTSFNFWPYGITLLCGGVYLYFVVPKPSGFHVGSVTVDKTTTFNLIDLSDVGETVTVISNAKMAGCAVERNGKACVVLRLSVDKTIVDNHTYRASWGVPELTLNGS